MQKGFYQAIVFVIFVSLLLIIYNNLFLNSLATENTLINSFRGKDVYQFEVDLRSCADSASEVLIVDSTSIALHASGGPSISISSLSDYNAVTEDPADEAITVTDVDIDVCYDNQNSNPNTFTVNGIANSTTLCTQDFNGTGGPVCFSFDCDNQTSFTGSDLGDLVVNFVNNDTNLVLVDHAFVTAAYTANKRELDTLSLVTGVQVRNVGGIGVEQGHLYHADTSSGTLTLLGDIASLNGGRASCVTVGAGSIASGDTLLFTFNGGAFPLYVN